MKSINLILVFIGLLGGAVAAAEKPTATKPNIIYLLSDDMGYGDIGFNGCKDILTPNLDRLAKQGAILECLYGQPVCSRMTRQASWAMRWVE